MQHRENFYIAPSRYGKRAVMLIAFRWIKGMPFMHPLFRALRIKRMWGGGHINWKKLLNNGQFPPKHNAKPRVLIATSTGAHLGASRVEQTIGAALRLRDASPSFLLCDAALPACMMCESVLISNTETFIKSGGKKLLCNTCFAPAASAIAPLGIDLHRYNDFLTDAEKKNIDYVVAAIPESKLSGFSQDGICLGEHAMSAACRFFGTSDIFSVEKGEEVFRRYLVAAWFTMLVCQKLFEQGKFDVIVMHHGIYIPQGVIADVARKFGIRVVTWHPSYRKGTFIFSHNDTYHRTMIDEPTDSWRNMPWDSEKEERIMKYLSSRHTGSSDWIWFHEKPMFDRNIIINQLNLDSKKPIIGLLTNVVWDAHLHYPNNAYSNMMEWILDTIEHFREREDVQLVIRVHPAEVYGNVKSTQTVVNEIKKHYSSLPPSIKIIPPLSEISTYSLMALCDSALIYSTKTGIELAAGGMSVIVAGEAWVRGKGFTIDASDPESYRNILRQLPLGKGLSAEQINLARRYAYHFFFRRMLDIDIFVPAKTQPPFELSINSLDDIMPNKCKGLDIVCDGILHGTEFTQD